MKKLQPSIITYLIRNLALLPIFLSVLKAQTTPHVYLQLSSQTMTIGDTLTMDVGITQGDSIKSVLIFLNYDEARYRYLNGYSAELFQEATFFDIHIHRQADDSLLYLVGVTLGAGRYVKGPGVFFTVQFVAIDTGTATFRVDSLKFMTPSLRYFDGIADSANSHIYPRDTFPPAPISNFRVQESGSGELQFTWLNPNDDDFRGVKILRSTEGFLDSVSASATVVYDGLGTSFTDANLKNRTIYYYSAFTYDEIPNYSRPVYVKAEPKAVYVYVFPNPFSPYNGAKIKTIFPYDTAIDVTIYDAVGNLVVKLYKDLAIQANDATLDLSWDGRNGNGDIVANGVYYCIVKSARGDKIIEKVAVVR